ncbi:hypothetical protein Cgig2_016167 [Carnegiea gigantea]|uniref:FAR1-related sequence 11-like HTH-like domain-containing protein n=1 Tax=Carnegiea gigantea TaxID=171969 RepID=A0A9Q1KP69_9CARY|nr:hypothetical protein Cgig2_016167 [Carnegiea gigantea]
MDNNYYSIPMQFKMRTMIDNYERRHAIEIDLNEEIEEFNDNVEKKIDLNKEAEGMNEEVEKEQIDMGEELNEDTDGSNNRDKVPNPCVGMCFDSGQEYITSYHKRRILNNDTVGVPVTKNFKSLVVESGGHENLPFNERDMRNAYTNSKFKEVQEEVHGLMHTNANKCGGDEVYGRRRLQILEENESNSTLKDPPDRRRKGRALAKRQPHPSEKGTANKKMLKKQELDRNEQIIQSTFSSVEARRGGASDAYDDTLLEMGNWEDGNSQDLSLNSGINWFNSQP